MTLVEVVIALAITGLTVAGIVAGYIFCMTATVKAELIQAGNARAMERIEEARSAQWDTSAWPIVDQLVATNFPDKVVSLDMPGSGSGGTSATIETTISQIIEVFDIKLDKGKRWTLAKDSLAEVSSMLSMCQHSSLAHKHSGATYASRAEPA